jgi:hypothetical protein
MSTPSPPVRAPRLFAHAHGASAPRRAARCPSLRRKGGTVGAGARVRRRAAAASVPAPDLGGARVGHSRGRSDTHRGRLAPDAWSERSSPPLAASRPSLRGSPAPKGSGRAQPNPPRLGAHRLRGRRNRATDRPTRNAAFRRGVPRASGPGSANPSPYDRAWCAPWRASMERRGQSLGDYTEPHRSAECGDLLSRWDAKSPADGNISGSLDHHAAHPAKKTPTARATVRNRLNFVLSPTHGSGLNRIETFLANRSRQLLRGPGVAPARSWGTAFRRLGTGGIPVQFRSADGGRPETRKKCPVLKKG